MSDSGQGDGQRSWWEKPDPEPAAQDPYQAPAGPSPDADAHDPYRSTPVEPPTQAYPATPPTESIPRYGEQARHEPSPYAAPQQQSSWPSPQQDTVPGQDQQYPNPPYGAAQHPNQQYPGPYGGPRGGYEQPPVAGMAHAVLWTSVGGLVLMFTFVGWIAAIVALALTPGARREILESGGTKRGLGFLLAGKICAWVNIGLSVLLVIGLAIIIGIATSGGFDTSSTFDSNGLNTLFVH